MRRPVFRAQLETSQWTTDAKPKTVQVGDPITVTNTISGRGNFDRVNAPVLEDERGWHKYPPSSKFKQDDEVGLSGTKTFETVLSPNEKKQGLPLLAFSYFDPGEGTICDPAQRADSDQCRGRRSGCIECRWCAARVSDPGYRGARGIIGRDCRQTTGYFVSADGATEESRILCPDLYTKRFLGSARCFRYSR
jgi:hypothetical protein